MQRKVMFLLRSIFKPFILLHNAAIKGIINISALVFQPKMAVNSIAYTVWSDDQ